jgi:hypothetical protein
MGVENLSSADVENLVAPVKSLRLNAQNIVVGIRTEAFQASPRLKPPGAFRYPSFPGPGSFSQVT